jgi:arabinose-5-phosphate isomerase
MGNLAGTNFDPQQLLGTARRTLDIEARAIAQLATRLGPGFAAACALCLACRGRVVVTGLGKSGHVGGKIAATLASTGTPAFFLHAGEANHGDLGMIAREDVVLAISNSGETPEIVALLPQLRRLGVPLIALTGAARSTLAREAQVNIDVSVAEEACPHNLTPTASTTATLAMGDALAIALLEARGFSTEDFARSHPGGSLGRKLLLRVADLMHSGAALPQVRADTMLSGGLLEMTHKKLGLTAVVDASQRLLGVFTDGDLRRALERQLDPHVTPMSAVMTATPRTIDSQALAAEAAHRMEVHGITALLVVDAQGQLVGAVSIHDLLRAGVV